MVWFKENHEIWRICRSPILFQNHWNHWNFLVRFHSKGPKAWQLHRNVARLPGFSPAFLGLGHQPLVKLNWKLSRKPQPRPWIHIHFTTPRHCEEMWITFPNYSCFKYLQSSQTKSNAQSSARVHYKLHYSTGCPILSSLVAAASALRRDQGLGPFFENLQVSSDPSLLKYPHFLLMHWWNLAICCWIWDFGQNVMQPATATFLSGNLQVEVPISSNVGGLRMGYQCWHRNLGFSWDDSQGGSI